MKSKRLIALILSTLMVLSQMSVVSFAADEIAVEAQSQPAVEQTVDEEQPAEAADAEETAAPAEDKAAPAAEAKAAVEKKAAAAKKASAKASFNKSKTVDGVKVTVKAAKGVFPKGSKLSVKKVKVPAAVDTEDAVETYAFDISILVDGKEVQPDGKAEVSFTTAEVAKHDTEVYHMDGSKAEELKVSESGETATVTADGFSTYVISFTQGGSPTSEKTYTMSEGQSALVVDIFEKVTGETYASKYNTAGPYNVLISPAIQGVSVELNSGWTTLTIDNNAGIQDGTTFTLTLEAPDNKGTDVFNVKVEKAPVDNPVVVSFNTDGGQAPAGSSAEIYASQTIEKGSVPKKPADPVKDGHTFLYWYYISSDTGKEVEYGFDVGFNRNVELRAKWSHEHVWDPAVRSDDKSTLTYKCLEQGDANPCPVYGTKKYNAVLSAENVTYSGEEYSFKDNVKLTKDEGFPKECVVELVEPVQWKKGSEVLKEAPTDAGDYTVQVKVKSNGNIRYLWANFKIARLPVTVKAVDTSKYVGEDDPAFDFTAVDKDNNDIKSLLLSDVPTFKVYRYYETGENPGTYRIDDWDNDGGLINNYKIIFNDQGKLTIKAATDVPVAYDDLEYTGEAQELVYAPTLPDGTSFLFSATEDGTYTDKIPTGTDAGTYNIWYKPAKDGKAIGEAAKLTAVIAPKEITVSVKGFEGVYDAKWHATSTSFDGIIEGDESQIEVRYSLRGKITEDNKGAINIDDNGWKLKNVGTKTIYYKATVKNNESCYPNYKIADDTEEGTAILTVTKAALTVTAADASVTYGEAFTPAENGYTVEGWIDEGQPTVNLTTAYKAGDNAGTYDIVPTVTGDGLTNYELKTVNGTLTVNKKEVKVTWPEKDEYVYTGKEQTVAPTLDPALDEGSYTVTGNKGTNADYYHAEIKLSTEAAKNYELSGDDEFYWEITKKALTITANDKTIKYNESAGKLEATGTGFVEGESMANISGSKRCEAPDYSKGDDIGSYDIIPNESTFKNNNYDITLAKGKLTVEPADLKVTWDYKEPFVYDGTKHVVTATLDTDSICGSDKVNITYLDKETIDGSEVSYTREETDAGEYKAKIGTTGSAAKNYTIPNAVLEWKIAKRVVYLKTPVTEGFVFNGAKQSLAIEFVNVVPGESLRPIYSGDYEFYHKGDCTTTITGAESADPDTTKASNYKFVTTERSETEVDSTDNKLTYAWKIAPMGVTIIWPENKTVSWTGSEVEFKPITLTPDTDVEGISLTPVTQGVKGTDEGEYTAKVTGITVVDADTKRAAVAGDYKLPETTKQVWKIVKSSSGGGGSVTDPVADVIKMIKALDSTKSTYAADAQAVVDAYNKLTDAQKADDRFKETDVAAKLAGAQETASDKKAADEASALINKLPADPATAKEADAQAAYAAYMALTDTQKALLDDSAKKKVATYGYYYETQYAKAQTVKLKSVKAKKGRKAVAKWSKNADVSGYQLYYKAKGKKAKKVTISKASTVKKTVKKLKAGKKYSFKVRTYTKVYNPATGATEKVYGQWSKVKKAKAKK